MTDLLIAHPGQKKLGLVIDLDLCVGCHACASFVRNGTPAT
jgi:Fe-S-cluster-containing dehydrogenase component